jgi:hypothetical protein
LVNEKKKIPLSYISGESEKLNVKYSILVKQFALSDGAFDFWNKNLSIPKMVETFTKANPHNR